VSGGLRDSAPMMCGATRLHHHVCWRLAPKKAIELTPGEPVAPEFAFGRVRNRHCEDVLGEINRNRDVQRGDTPSPASSGCAHDLRRTLGSPCHQMSPPTKAGTIHIAESVIPRSCLTLRAWDVRRVARFTTVAFILGAHAAGRSGTTRRRG